MAGWMVDAAKRLLWLDEKAPRPRIAFQYKRLDTSAFEIRLVRIELGRWDDEIRLSLWHT